MIRVSVLRREFPEECHDCACDQSAEIHLYLEDVGQEVVLCEDCAEGLLLQIRATLRNRAQIGASEDGR
jgi:hypothetical protein